MLFIRPIEMNDLDDLLELAKMAGEGLTSLPECRDTLAHNIQHSIDSFASNEQGEDDYYLLAMVDTEKQKLAGTAGVHSRVGARQAYYAYRLISMTHHSHSLDKQVRDELLHLSNEYTDCSEVGTLFLNPEYRGNGHWLAKSRYLLMGEFPHLFADEVVAELRGWSDDEGNSPFWDAIGAHFFEMTYDEADTLCGSGSNLFITELMPKYPIYTAMLPQAARDVIGKPNDEGVRALQLLEKEGFRYQKNVDIFDGGPLVSCRVQEIKSVRNADHGKATVEAQPENGTAIVSNTNLQNFRVVQAPVAKVDGGQLALSQENLDALGCSEGDQLRYLMNDAKK